jgi:hypothetical protein
VRRNWRSLPRYNKLAAWRMDSEEGRPDVIQYNSWLFDSDDSDETIQDDQDEGIGARNEAKEYFTDHNPQTRGRGRKSTSC